MHVPDLAVSCSPRKRTALCNITVCFMHVRLLGLLTLLAAQATTNKASIACCAVAAAPAVEVALPYGDLRSKPPPKGYVAGKCTGGLKIDGHLNEPCWTAAPWTDDFVDIVGPTGPAPWFATRAKMLWDDDALYVAAYMEEPRAFAHQTLHDSIIFQDNDFEIFIDPDGDNHMYYEVEINALGHIWDLMLAKPYRNGGPPVMNWESIQPRMQTQQTGPTGWKPLSAAVHIDGAVNAAAGSTGWSVEFALPWTLLKQAANRDAPPKAGDQWRISFSRVQYNVTWDAQQKAYVKDPADQPGYNWVWTPQWQVAMHQPETWGYLQFSSAAVPQPDCQDLDGQQSCASVAERLRPDVTWAARALLMDIYFAQTVCWQEYHNFCSRIEEMNITDISPDLAANLKVETTSVSFVACTLVRLHSDAAAAVLVSVDQTGRLVQYPANTAAGDDVSLFDPFAGNSVWVTSEQALQPEGLSSTQ